MSDASVFNMDEALERVDHDRETFQMMTEIFLDHDPKDLGAAQALWLPLTWLCWHERAIKTRWR